MDEPAGVDATSMDPTEACCGENVKENGVCWPALIVTAGQVLVIPGLVQPEGVRPGGKVGDDIRALGDIVPVHIDIRPPGRGDDIEGAGPGLRGVGTRYAFTVAVWPAVTYADVPYGW